MAVLNLNDFSDGDVQGQVQPALQQEVEQPKGNVINFDDFKDVAPAQSGSNNYGLRPDGTQKANGFFGPLKSKSGKDMTEYSIGLNINGKEMDVPSLVPTLTEDEKNFLLTEPNPKDIPEAIFIKVSDHAKKRIAEGKSPFASNEESPQNDLLRLQSERSNDPVQEGQQSLMDVLLPEGSRKLLRDINPIDLVDLFKGKDTPRIAPLIKRDLSNAGKRIGNEITDFSNSFNNNSGIDNAIGLGETALQFGGGAIGYIPSKAGMAVTTGLGKTLSAGNYLSGDGSIPPEKIAARAEQVEKAIGEFIPKILGEPKTEVAKKGGVLLEDLFSTGLAPIKTAVDYYKSIGWPNFGNMLGLSGELLAFKGIHSGSKAAIRKASKISKMIDKGDVSIGKLEKNVDEMRSFLDKNNPELINAIDDFKTDMNIARTRQEKNQQLINGADGFSGIDIPKPIQPEIKLPTKSELSQQGRGFEGDVRRPNLGNEQASGYGKDIPNTPEGMAMKVNQIIPGIELKYDGAFDRSAIKKSPLHQFTPQEGPLRGRTFGVEDVTVDNIQSKLREMEGKTRVELLTEEGLPKTEYQINPETGKPESTLVEGERSAYQIDEGGVKLVESVPGEKSVWQIFIDPVKNESGAIDLSVIKEMEDRYGKSPKAGSLLNRLNGIPKDDIELSGIGPYLRGLGQKKIDWNEFKKAVDDSGFDVSKETLGQPTRGNFKTEYKSPQYKQYSLEGMEEGTYVENLYKFEPNQKRIDEIERQFERGEITEQRAMTLLSLAETDGKTFNEGHWKDGTNVMAHDRRHVRDVIVSDKAKEVLYLDEAQSKWHDRGGREGYVKEELPDGWSIKQEGNSNAWQIKNPSGETLIRVGTKGEVLAKLKMERDFVPNAPFKKSWPSMIMRDVISQAVNEGRDGVAWSTAAIQKERYGGHEKTDYASLYDKKIPKIVKNEFGGEPELVDTRTKSEFKPTSEIDIVETPTGFDVKDITNNRILESNIQTMSEAMDIAAKLEDKLNYPTKKEKIWYTPITAKMRQMFSPTSSNLSIAIDTLLEPIRNNRGEVTIPKSQKEFTELLTPGRRAAIRKIGLDAETAGVSLKDYLKQQGMSKGAIRQMSKLHEMARIEQPFQSALTQESTYKGSDPLKFEVGDINVNVSKDAKPQIPVPKRIVDQVMAAVRTSTPSIIRTFNPSLSAIRKFKAPVLKDLWHKANGIERARIDDMKIVQSKVTELRDIYPSKKLREEAYVRVMSKDKLGRDALEKSRIKPIDTAIEYEGLALEMEPLFRDLLDRVNATRKAIGKKRISRMDNYMPMIAQENFYDTLRKGFKGSQESYGRPNLVLDTAEAIAQRHNYGTAEATNFNHIKRGKLRTGTRLEMDPLKLYADYSNTALKHIHYSPLNAFVEQLVKNPFKDMNGKDWRMEKRNPELAEYLSRWSNKLAGRPNVILPEALRFAEKSIQKLSNNLTVATLGWSARTILVQPTALLPVMTEFGVAPTMRGVLDTITKSDRAPVDKSNVLAIRTADAFVGDLVDMHLGGGIRKAIKTPATKALDAMKFVDKVTAEVGWRTAYAEAIKNMGEMDAVRFADEATVRTQGSGFAGDLSPIQMNAVGKAITLWQTFTINHVNWIARELMDIKKPERNPVETGRRVLTYLVGTALVNSLFEDQMGIQSPQPAPLKAIQKGLEEGDTGAAAAFKGLMEMTELLPIGSSIKFGSDPAGAVAQFFGDASEGISKDLPLALNGDKKAMQRLAFLIARGTGVPGAQQIKRIVTGEQRGETHVGSVLGRYSEDSGSGKRVGRSRRSNRRTRKSRR